MFKSCGLLADSQRFSLFDFLACGLSTGFSSIYSCLFRVFVNRFLLDLTSLFEAFSMFSTRITMSKTIKYKLGVV